MLIENEFYETLYYKIKSIYSDVARELNMPILEPYPYNNINEEKNIIFSMPIIHPEVNILERKKGKYFFSHPLLESFKVEESSFIHNNIKEFVQNKDGKRKSIAYVAAGSFTSYDEQFYKYWLNILRKYKYKVIVSWNAFDSEKNSTLRTSDVYIGEKLPQKYILSQSDLFITSGG